MTKSYKIFESQLSATCNVYPNLRIKEKEGRKYLHGTLDIFTADGIAVKSFLVEIHCSNNFPYSFPTLYEVGDTIPNNIDWHKYSNGSCCITVKPDEILKCRNGITVIEFIKLYAIPYLANQYHKIEFGNYLNEYSHGSKGLVEYYTELIGTGNKAIWLRCFRLAFGNDNENKLMFAPCFCNSGLRYANCHKSTVSNIRKIGKDIIIASMRIISKGDSFNPKII